MDYLEPWRTQIAHFNVKDQFDMGAFGEEVFTLFTMTTGEDESQSVMDINHFPVMISMRDNVITPTVLEYARECFKYEMDDFYIETNGKWIPDGEGLYPHYHPGSVISVICYPVDSANGLNMFDPRTHACRGYPKEMRWGHFPNLRISPRAGDIFIFPSYVQHSVSHVTEETRLSLLHEYYVTKNL